MQFACKTRHETLYITFFDVYCTRKADEKKNEPYADFIFEYGQQCTPIIAV